MDNLTPDEVRRACSWCKVEDTAESLDVIDEPCFRIASHYLSIPYEYDFRPDDTAIILLASRCMAVAAGMGWLPYITDPNGGMFFIKSLLRRDRTKAIPYDPTNEREWAIAVIRSFLQIPEVEE